MLLYEGEYNNKFGTKFLDQVIGNWRVSIFFLKARDERLPARLRRAGKDRLIRFFELGANFPTHRGQRGK